jgi:hypothetical protein
LAFIVLPVLSKQDGCTERRWRWLGAIVDVLARGPNLSICVDRGSIGDERFRMATLRADGDDHCTHLCTREKLKLVGEDVKLDTALH